MYQDIQFFRIKLPKERAKPLALRFDPKLNDQSDSFVNQILGYPQCPLIGRYNKGEYKIADVMLHFSVKCTYDKQKQQYKCGEVCINLPKQLNDNLRNIPQYIPTNKPQNQQKNNKIPQYNPIYFPVKPELTLTWIVSSGQLGKDFLNYLNHMYIFGSTLFLSEKLRRTTHYLPICAYLPKRSGIRTQEVERGISYQQFRSQYMSIHIKCGAPAFSPNNMRLGIQGMKLVGSNNNYQSNKAPKTVKYKQKRPNKEQKQTKQQQQFELNWEQLEQQIIKDKTQPVQQETIKCENLTKKGNQFSHQGYVHFYTSVLLEEEYKVYYHWHIQEQNRVEVLQQMLKQSSTIQEIVQGYGNFVERDQMYEQLSHLFAIK